MYIWSSWSWYKQDSSCFWTVKKDLVHQTLRNQSNYIFWMQAIIWIEGSLIQVFNKLTRSQTRKTSVSKFERNTNGDGSAELQFCPTASSEMWPSEMLPASSEMWPSEMLPDDIRDLLEHQAQLQIKVIIWPIDAVIIPSNKPAITCN
jgi:hypothetical protein